MKTRAIVGVLTLALFITSSTAEKDPRENEYCFAGCQQALAGLNFAGFPSLEDSYDAEPCENSLHVQSVLLCARAYCTTHQIHVGSRYASGRCEAGGYGFPNLSIVDNVTTKGIQQMKTLEYGDAPDIINTAVIPSRKLFELGERTVVSFKAVVLAARHNSNRSIGVVVRWQKIASLVLVCMPLTSCGKLQHADYSCRKAIFIFWGIVIAIGSGANLLTYLRAHRSTIGDRPWEAHSTNQWTAPIKRFCAQTRALFLLPATFGHSCCEPKWYGSIPPRAESVIICVYLALNVILCAVSYTAFPHNLDWDNKATQIWRYFSDRTGYLSYANFAIIFAFGIRNNILIWLTRWHFATFNRFHRWTARVAALEGILHSVGYTVFDFREGGYSTYIEDFARRYW
ncbi:MAG: hypothetical protein Q9179_004092 [Wetmoreana sp. 5 TL-2023]